MPNPDKAPTTDTGSPTRKMPSKPEPQTVKGNPPKPIEADLPQERYGQLTPTDKVAYHQAKLAYAQAYAQYDATEFAAHATFDKPYNDFVKARIEYDTAKKAVADAILAAQTKLDSIVSLAQELKLQPHELEKPDQAKAQLDRLAAAGDDYKKAADTVAAAVVARDKARAALVPLAQPGDLKQPNQVAQGLAEDQYALEMAQAQVALETAYDTYMVKQAEIVGHLPHKAKAA